MTEPIEINLDPIWTFRYIQNDNHNFQFLLLGKNNEALHTPFQCKDYLSDIFWAENTGRKIEIYGIEWEKGMLDISTPTIRMALLGGEATLEPHIPNLKSFLNAFEEKLGFSFTEITPSTNPKNIVLDFSQEWAYCGPMISAYTSLIRLSGMYNGEHPIEYLKKISAYKDSRAWPKNFTNYSYPDISRLDNMLPKLAALYAGRKPDFSWIEVTKLMGQMSTNSNLFLHDMGICGYNDFPTEKI